MVFTAIVIPSVGFERDNKISQEVPVTAGFIVLSEDTRRLQAKSAGYPERCGISGKTGVRKRR